MNDEKTNPVENGAGSTRTGPNTEDRPTAAANSETEAMNQDLQRQRDDYLDQLQRTRAEFANYQKRAKAQADSDRQYMVGALARDLLEVLDNFDRALAAARPTGPSAIVDGMEMVSKQLLAALAKHSVVPIEALGKPFDAHLHEALVQQPDAYHPEGTVVAELAKGYRLHDRVLRHSKVAVSTPAANTP